MASQRELDAALLDAVDRDSTTEIQALLFRRANVTARDAHNNTPLHVASLKGHDQCVSRLLLANADINALNSSCSSPLVQASRKGHHQCVALLLDGNANVNARDKESCTPLLLACRHGHHQCAELLLQANADLNVSDSHNNTPLHWASHQSHHHCVAVLIDFGADKSVVNRAGRTPEQAAASPEIARLIRSRVPAPRADERARTAETALAELQERYRALERTKASELEAANRRADTLLEQARRTRDEAEQRATLAERRVVAAEQRAISAEQRLADILQRQQGQGSPTEIDQQWMIPLDRLAIDESSSLGAGALGEVKRAMWNGSIPVAAKRLFFMATDPIAMQAMGGPLDSTQRQAVLRDFIKECSINASIRHPNIVMFLGVGIDRSANDEPRYLVLELMKRGSLHDELYPEDEMAREGPPMPIDRMASILLDITRALVYLHHYRRPPVLHLDLKPKNVLIDRSGVAKIGDLGGAHVIRSTAGGATRGIVGIGTPVYWAPEMEIEGEEKGPPADMFSLGVLACEMSSGRPPNPTNRMEPVGELFRVVPEQRRRAAEIAAIRHAEIRELINYLIVDQPDRRWNAMQVHKYLAERVLQHHL